MVAGGHCSCFWGMRSPDWNFGGDVGMCSCYSSKSAPIESDTSHRSVFYAIAALFLFQVHLL